MKRGSQGGESTGLLPESGERSLHVERRAAMLLVCLALALSVACRGARPTSIGTILDDPRGHHGRHVTIAGRVVAATNLMLVKWYRVEDETGSIVVVASGAVPRQGTELRVTGTVRQAFALGDESLTVILEDPERP